MTGSVRNLFTEHRILGFLFAGAVLVCAWSWLSRAASAEVIPAHHVEGVTHGFLVMRDEAGQIVAYGDMVQETHHGRVTSTLTFHYADGSLYEDTTIYTEHGVFRVLSDHLLEKGPSFKQPMETWVDARSGMFKARSFDKDKEQWISQKLKIPADLANGIIYVVLKNISPKTPTTTVSMVVGTPKPRIVKLIITPQGEEPFFIDGSRRVAIHYVMKVDIGGVAGVVAPIIGKQPADTNIWIAAESVPTFLKSQGPLYDGGPIWTIELTLPRWSSTDHEQEKPVKNSQ